MNSAGYSGKPLIEKLGFKFGAIVFVQNTPGWYSELADENGLELVPVLPATHTHLFLDSKTELADFLKTNDLNEIEKSLWVSWPKKASGIQTDLTEQIFRDLILPLGWVDIKVAAIDETWSGLKFLRRKTKS